MEGGLLCYGVRLVSGEEFSVKVRESIVKMKEKDAF